MMKGPYTIRNMPVLLREWRRDFNLKKDLLRALPLWVKLPNLPLYLWGDNTLGKIVSAIGSPIVTDECTASKLQVSYARILVEVDITKELLQEITIRDRSGNKEEKQWRPRAKAINTGKQQIQVSTVPKVTPAKQPEGSTSYDHGPLLFQIQPSEEWITPTKNANERGKDHKKTTTLDWLRCTNGFDALGVSKDSRALDDPGPC
ncbi:hypothetical protein JHK85_001554 [Glycine max]|uniref:Uncharacterized protein n=2 Tax=Glycine subgen. Soja TaxID=1462606 RepID=A0A0R0LEN2_SOYBN|nr:hypothetical protein JHK85_001554 [Glycine max]RZC29660.1 hypothetical protein D0Y65_001303 [Glycine soja]